jgi:hypothetical protein
VERCLPDDVPAFEHTESTRKGVFFVFFLQASIGATCHEEQPRPSILTVLLSQGRR